MAHSDFSWRKLLSFIGAAVLVFVAFVTISTGIGIAVEGKAFNGVVTCLGGVSSIALAVILYRNYQKWSDENMRAKVRLTNK